MSAAVVTADGLTARALRLDPGAFVLDVVRIRLADGSPISLEDARFPADRFPDLLEQSLGGSIYEVLQAHYGVSPAEAEERIEVRLASADEAQILGVVEGAALLSITRRTCDADGRPIEFSHDLFRADRTLITVRTRGNQGTAGSARTRGRVVELRARSS
jgi:GntR family transcriptional regulator